MEACGVSVTWHVVFFMDDAEGCERAVGRSLDLSHAQAIKARWERETCAMLAPAPIKHSTTGLHASANRKKPAGRDPSAKKTQDSIATRD